MSCIVIDPSYIEVSDNSWNKIEIYDVCGECKIFINGVEWKEGKERRRRCLEYEM